MNIKKLGLFLLIIFFTLPTTSLAADIGSLYISGARLTQTGSELQVAFSVKNISEVQQEATYGLRVQEVDGEQVFETPVDSISLKSTEEVIRYATIELPTSAIGEYEIFLLSRDAVGLVSMLKYVGKIITTLPDNIPVIKPATISNCVVTDLDREIMCNVTGVAQSHIDINYAVNQGSLYGTLVTSGVSNNVEIKDGLVSLELSDVLSGGAYTYSIWLSEEILAQRIVVRMATPIVAEVEDSESSNTTTKDAKEIDYIFWIVVTLPAILLIMLLYKALRRPKVMVVIFMATGLSLASATIAAITLTDTQPLAHIFNGLS